MNIKQEQQENTKDSETLSESSIDSFEREIYHRKQKTSKSVVGVGNRNIDKQLSSINYTMIGGQKIKYLTKLDIPKQIYVRKESDIVKQLSSLGMKTYVNSHDKPYGAFLKTGSGNSEKENIEKGMYNNTSLNITQIRQIWDKIRRENVTPKSPSKEDFLKLQQHLKEQKLQKIVPTPNLNQRADILEELRLSRLIECNNLPEKQEYKSMGVFLQNDQALNTLSHQLNNSSTAHCAFSKGPISPQAPKVIFKPKSYKGLSESFYKIKYKGVQNESILQKFERQNMEKQQLQKDALQALNDSKLTEQSMMMSPKSTSPMSSEMTNSFINFDQTLLQKLRQKQEISQKIIENQPENTFYEKQILVKENETFTMALGRVSPSKPNFSYDFQTKKSTFVSPKSQKRLIGIKPVMPEKKPILHSTDLYAESVIFRAQKSHKQSAINLSDFFSKNETSEGKSTSFIRSRNSNIPPRNLTKTILKVNSSSSVDLGLSLNYVHKQKRLKSSIGVRKPHRYQQAIKWAAETPMFRYKNPR